MREHLQSLAVPIRYGRSRSIKLVREEVRKERPICPVMWDTPRFSQDRPGCEGSAEAGRAAGRQALKLPPKRKAAAKKASWP